MSTTFENALTGDTVYSTEFGYGEINSIAPNGEYPVHVKFKDYANWNIITFTTFGHELIGDLHQTLFWDKPEIIAPEQPKKLPNIPVDTKMMVWRDESAKYERYFSHFDKMGVCHCFVYNFKSWSNKGTTPWKNWEVVE